MKKTFVKYPEYIKLSVLTFGIFIIVYVIDNFTDGIILNHHGHSAIEAMGGMAAIVMTFFLLQRSDEKNGKYYVILAVSFFSLAAFDISHSLTEIGDKFVFLRTMSDLFGSFILILLWFSSVLKLDQKKYQKIIFYTIISLCIIFSISTHAFLDLIPPMILNGSFTPIASILNLLSSFLFLIAAIKLFIIYHQTNENEFFLFGAVTFLFAIAGFLFPVSDPWYYIWWLWHLIRLVSYVVLLTIAVRSYSKKNESLIKSINEKNILEQELRQSEEKHRSIFESSIDSFIITDFDGQIVEANPAACKSYGYTHAEMISMNASKLIHPEYLHVFEQFKKDIKERGSFIGENVEIAKDGKIIYSEIRGSIINFNNKSHLLAVIRDLSEKKNIEQRLAENEKRFQIIFNKNPDAIFLAEADTGLIVDANPAAEVLLKKNRDEIIGIHQRYLHPEDTAQENEEKFKECLTNNLDLVQSEVIDSENNRIPVEIAIAVLEHRENMYLIGIFRNISERIESQNRISEALSFNETLFAESPIGKLVYDGEGQAILVNKMAQEVLETAENEITKHTMYNFPIWQSSNVINLFESILNNGGTESQGIEFKSKSGETKYLDCSFSKISRLNKPHLLVILKDISELKRTEKSMKDMILKLEISNKELEQFAYVASHDLQEPLRMVSSYTQLLQKRYKGKLDESANEFIHYAVDGANRMQLLINDPLQFSRVTTKGSQFVKTDLNSLVGSAIAQLQENIQKTNTLIATSELTTISVDSKQIRRVFISLIENAIKYKSEKDPIINITGRILENEYEVSIADNGIGVSPAYAKKIFEIFERLHSNDKYTGTGIGLAICKRIIERHGGNIWVESTLGKGSTFKFTISNNISEV
ncbi:MAG: PAS domain S-box protein [Melioribacteraceae bacterium]|nr:PAS domain S-box protein [Melioribacteraceae bacterium]MCF8413506.1 PAS domain S-box protein [Melioribacteraceae bacterium]MCF8431715.1 PAS domain S-box protein [Melioribacteraceae bacterium]